MLTLVQQRELQNRNAELERRLSERNHELTEKEHRIEKLKWELAELKRKLFGNKQGESVSDEQLQLALAELEAERQEQQLSEKEVAGYTRKKEKSDPKPRIPDHLEEVEEIIIPEEVRADPGGWECIGEEVTEELDMEPARFIKRRIIRPKYVRKGETDRKPVVAPLPPRVIPGGIPSAALMAFLIVSKYADHRVPRAWTGKMASGLCATIQPMRDVAPRKRLTGAVFKSPLAAVSKRHGRERKGKRLVQRDSQMTDREMNASEPPMTCRNVSIIRSKPEGSGCSGISWEATCIAVSTACGMKVA